MYKQGFLGSYIYVFIIISLSIFSLFINIYKWYWSKCQDHILSLRFRTEALLLLASTLSLKMEVNEVPRFQLLEALWFKHISNLQQYSDVETRSRFCFQELHGKSQWSSNMSGAQKVLQLQQKFSAVSKCFNKRPCCLQEDQEGLVDPGNTTSA